MEFYFLVKKKEIVKFDEKIDGTYNIILDFSVKISKRIFMSVQQIPLANFSIFIHHLISLNFILCTCLGTYYYNLSHVTALNMTHLSPLCGFISLLQPQSLMILLNISCDQLFLTLCTQARVLGGLAHTEDIPSLLLCSSESFSMNFPFSSFNMNLKMSIFSLKCQSVESTLVTNMYVFMADLLALNNQLVFSFLGRTTSPASNFIQVPVVPFVGLWLHEISHSSYVHWYPMSCSGDHVLWDRCSFWCCYDAQSHSKLASTSSTMSPEPSYI